MMENTSDQINLTEMEADIIGEVMNISMGAAATAMSDILDKGQHNHSGLRIVKSGNFRTPILNRIRGADQIRRRYRWINILLLKVEDFKNPFSLTFNRCE